MPAGIPTTAPPRHPSPTDPAAQPISAPTAITAAVTPINMSAARGGSLADGDRAPGVRDRRGRSGGRGADGEARAALERRPPGRSGGLPQRVLEPRDRKARPARAEADPGDRAGGPHAHGRAR